MAKIKKSTPVWVMPGDYFKATKAVEDAGVKTYSRVNVWYFDVTTFVLTAVVVSVLWILIHAFN